MHSTVTVKMRGDQVIGPAEENVISSFEWFS